MEKVQIENVELTLSHPDNLNIKWTGQNDLVRQIMASWNVISDDDIPLNPRIVGKPGAGKTTALNILGGMDKLTNGKVIVDGKRIDKLSDKELIKYRRNDIGFVFQL